MNAKKGLNTVSNDCAIFISAIVLFWSIVATFVSDEFVIFISLLVFCLATIVLSFISLSKYKSLVLKIVTIILLVLIATGIFLKNGYIYSILCIIPIGLGIAAIFVKNNIKEENKEAQTLEIRIARLKRLKETNILTESQYEESIKKITESL